MNVRRLPKIVGDACTQLSKCLEDLDALPQVLTGEPSTHIIGAISDVSRLVNEYVRGSPAYNSLIQQNLRAFREFKTGIESTAPVFVPTLEPLSSDGMNLLDMRRHIAQ